MLQTPLTQWHRDHHGRLVDFAGWEMPVQYTTIVQEHQSVRQRAGLFDISHMGRLYFDGDDATRFLDYVTTIPVSSMQPGKIRYALATNEQGGIQDDILVYRREKGLLVVVNASNREKIISCWSQLAKQFDVALRDETSSTGMLALQGSESLEILTEIGIKELSNLGYYRFLETKYLETVLTISRTGYTGEDGFEIIASNDQILPLWDRILEAGQGRGAVVCGLGCRDTLRLEAGMPLYGHELSETVDPLTAGLSFAVSLNKDDFLGRDALLRISEQSPQERRIGLELDGRRIAREETAILDETGNRIGSVTSGTFSPTLQKSIAMGYVPAENSAVGTRLLIDFRGKTVTAHVVELPFYRRNKKSR